MNFRRTSNPLTRACQLCSSSASCARWFCLAPRCLGEEAEEGSTGSNKGCSSNGRRWFVHQAPPSRRSPSSARVLAHLPQLQTPPRLGDRMGRERGPQISPHKLERSPLACRARGRPDGGAIRAPNSPLALVRLAEGSALGRPERTRSGRVRPTKNNGIETHVGPDVLHISSGRVQALLFEIKERMVDPLNRLSGDGDGDQRRPLCVP